MAASGYSVAAGGAVLTREQVAGLLVEPLMAQAVVLQAGPRIFDSEGGVPLRIPKITVWDLDDPWRYENTLIAEDDPTYGEVVLLPSSLKSLKVIHRFSNELARHSVVDIANTLRDALVRRIANVLDKAMLVGDGAADTVKGIANATGVQVMAAVGAPTVDDLLTAEGMLMGANANPETSAWFLAPRSLTSLRSLREGLGTGQYLLLPDPTVAGKFTLLGRPVFVTTQIPINLGAGTNESRIILADMSQVAVGRDVDVDFKLLEERYADYDQLAIRVVSRWDIAPLNAEAVVVLNGVTP